MAKADRKIGGKNYEFHHTVKGKDNVRYSADSLRSRGFLVRVFAGSERGHYDLFAREHKSRRRGR